MRYIHTSKPNQTKKQKQTQSHQHQQQCKQQYAHPEQHIQHTNKHTMYMYNICIDIIKIRKTQQPTHTKQTHNNTSKHKTHHNTTSTQTIIKTTHVYNNNQITHPYVYINHIQQTQHKHK